MPDRMQGPDESVVIDESLTQEFLEQAPPELTQLLQGVSEQYGLNAAVLATAILSIFLINNGSAKYGELGPHNDQNTNRAIARQAAGQVLPGVAGMTVTAFIAANPLFALPQVAAVIGAGVQYLSTLSENTDKVVNNFRLRTMAQLNAVIVGIGTAYAFTDKATDVFPVIGLTSLSYAFADAKNQFYRHLTVTGGSALVLGSTAGLIESFYSNNEVGMIMSSAFLVLNATFTQKEIQLARQEGRLQEIVDKVFSYLNQNKS